MKVLPNRLAVYVTALGALAAGLLPVIANLDWESTAGVLGAVVAITGVVAVWLLNWGKYEARGEPGAIEEAEEEPPDEFDEATADPIPEEAVAAAKMPPGPVHGPQGPTG